LTFRSSLNASDFIATSWGFPRSLDLAKYLIFKCGDSQIGLTEKSAGSRPAKGTDEVRRYERHWTPVHIDFHVDDFEVFLAKAVNARVKCEQEFEGGTRPTVTN
jgi:hypothetical protein